MIINVGEWAIYVERAKGSPFRERFEAEEGKLEHTPVTEVTKAIVDGRDSTVKYVTGDISMSRNDSVYSLVVNTLTGEWRALRSCDEVIIVYEVHDWQNLWDKLVQGDNDG